MHQFGALVTALRSGNGAQIYLRFVIESPHFYVLDFAPFVSLLFGILFKNKKRRMFWAVTLSLDAF